MGAMKPTKEQSEALAWWREISTGEHRTKDIDDADRWLSRMSILADLALAQNPPDDGEPVTAEWLAPQAEWHFPGHPYAGAEYGERGKLRWYPKTEFSPDRLLIGGDRVIENPTRGQVRQLLNLMGAN